MTTIKDNRFLAVFFIVSIGSTAYMINLNVSVCNTASKVYSIVEGINTYRSQTMTTLSSGDCYLTFDVTNYRDIVPPEVSISSPSDGTTFSTDSVTMSWLGSNSASGIDHYEVKVDSGSWLSVGTVVSHTLNDLSNGLHTLYVKAIDNYGNEAIDSVTITIDFSQPSDTTAPYVEITFIDVGDNLEGTWISFEWIYSDDVGIDYCEVRLDSQSWINVGLTNAYTFYKISDGTHTIEVKVYDTSGNYCIDSIEITITNNYLEISKIPLIFLFVAAVVFVTMKKMKK